MNFMSKVRMKLSEDDNRSCPFIDASDVLSELLKVEELYHEFPFYYYN